MRQTDALVAVALLIAVLHCAPPPAYTPNVSGLAALQALADSGKDLPRPRLPEGADTNDAAAYYRWGLRLGAKDTVEMSLYWASRLDPSWAEPLYARSLNTLMAASADAWLTFVRTRSPRAARQVTLSERQMRVTDSLYHVAWQRNPFMFSELEFRGSPPGRRGDPAYDGWRAFARGNFAAADSLLALALRCEPGAVGLRIYRARALFHLGRFDGVVSELEAARDTVRHLVEAQLSMVLPSVEMFDFAIGIARVHQDDFSAARDAFERALSQNLAFFWAHARLAGAALALRDTAKALRELDLAIELEGRDPVLRLYHGAVLVAAGRSAEAEAAFLRAIELNPHYAAPYYWLAFSYQKHGDTTAAVQQYKQFLSHAARQDPYRIHARSALAALGAAVADSS